MNLSRTWVTGSDGAEQRVRRRPVRPVRGGSAVRGQVHPYVLNFCKILLEKGLLHEFSDCVKAYRARYLQDNGIVEASVTTAVPLDDGQRKKLMEKLSAMTGKQIVLKERLDPAVLGGVRLEMDGKRYDNTVQSRLTAIHRAIGGQA